MLIGAIEMVKENKMDPRQAQAVANLSSKVLQSCKVDLDMLRFNAIEGNTTKAGEKVLQLVNA
jgi:hypothetical protein